MQVTGQQVAGKALALCTVEKNWLGKIKAITPQHIPYVEGGRTLSGMDCQGLVRWVLDELGVNHVKGSNRMWRTMLSEKGTIADCVSVHGGVPLGALIFICDYSTIPQGYTEPPDAEHVYIKVAQGWLLHASYSHGRLMVREFADKAVSNGGPTHYGLVAGVAYDGVVADADAGTMSEAPQPDMSEAPQSETNRFQPQYAHMVFARGSMGRGTQELQTALNRLGYKLNVDSRFGPVTEQAVRKFQEEHGLPADGRVGKHTWAALADAVNMAG